jgi:ergothioneine biosynthesis protein EgtB
MTAHDRQALIASYDRNRARTAELFGLLSDAAYYSRPIGLRNPIVFYEGHLPGFSFNTLVKRGLGQPSIDTGLEDLFARGIDPHESVTGAKARGNEADRWPSRESVKQFCEEADRQVRAALASGAIQQSGHPLLDRAQAAFSIIEHEATHLETLMYMWHRLPFEQKQRPEGYQPLTGGPRPEQGWVDVPAGRAALGVDRAEVPFAWDNECPAYAEDVAAFAVQRHNVTNGEFAEFVAAGGYREPRWWSPEDWEWVQKERIAHPIFWEPDGDAWRWRAMFDSVPLPESWPVFVSQAEASACARWKGLRLPTEAEYQRAAYGSPGGEPRQYPWGNDPPDETRGVFDFHSWDPQPAGSHPAGQSAWGVHDLVGNGWEWTSTEFGPFPGFTVLPSYPEYSAEFFDGEHFVMKGASPATVRGLLRPSFRNWFRSRYPYMYATFRCVTARGAGA